MITKKRGILLMVVLVFTVGVSSFVLASKGEASELSTIKVWEDLSVVEKVISVVAGNELSPLEYKKWYVKNKKAFASTKQVDKIRYQFSYIPQEVMVLKESDSEEGNVLRQLSKEYQGMEYYLFSFEDTLGNVNPFTGKQIEKVEERIQTYLAFEMQKNLKLVSGSDTLDCIGFHYERTIGMSPIYKFMCSFPSDLKSTKRVLLYQDVLFNQGTVKIQVKEDVLNLSPGLLLK